MPGYPKPYEIKCHVHLRSNSLRPRIELEPTSYPLAVEQREGLTPERLEALTASLLRH